MHFSVIFGSIAEIVSVKILYILYWLSNKMLVFQPKNFGEQKKTNKIRLVITILVGINMCFEKYLERL